MKICKYIALETSKFLEEKFFERVEYSRTLGYNIVGDETKIFDKEAENYIIELLKHSELRNSRVVSEELGEIELTDSPKYLVLIDPVDGSSNFSAGIPYVAVSIAIAPALRNGTLANVLAGAVAWISRNRVYSFAKNEGAYINDSKISGNVTTYSNIVATYINSIDVCKVMITIRYRIKNITLRCFGSASLDIIMTALGRYRAFIDLKPKLRNVDVAAALGFAKELNCYIAGINRSDPINTIRVWNIERINPLVLSQDRDFLNKLLGIVRSSA
ncbi:MAG: hypothetical protein DRO15_07845 [Thermoprotei archaeon]|nr:MAG: hypothetical protein DRO15_07845 [Thermoprotei archaeon]